MLAEPLAAEAAPRARKEMENQSYRVEALLAVEHVSVMVCHFSYPTPGASC